MLTQHQ